VLTTTGAPVNYAYDFCYDTAGARYTVAVQERAAQPSANGEYAWTDVTGTYRDVPLGGTPGAQSGRPRSARCPCRPS
ncbi:hypothetical protein LLE87_39940, partial [Paenibacillus polymyxa]|nr:hypothetical protein [Paenibacillus polymyxa]